MFSVLRGVFFYESYVFLILIVNTTVFVSFWYLSFYYFGLDSNVNFLVCQLSLSGVEIVNQKITDFIYFMLNTKFKRYFIFGSNEKSSTCRKGLLHTPYQEDIHKSFSRDLK